ncbi:hypothetical protein Patl1_28219 [Pistacia atlantica]|uniref:Uncharacterized protein n=1 Tax=Pistacia atlantica TaxID=434234 RepID=A0ACC1BHA0_9ROSI|nr:hypothetical protein Patl1_28219 [Pistacia atlantica]
MREWSCCESERVKEWSCCERSGRGPHGACERSSRGPHGVACERNGRGAAVAYERMKMEELRKLEQVQRTMSFMQTRGFVSNNQDSDRFLANLILLLVQPCGELIFDKKCSLISKHLPSLSASFLEEASLWLSQGWYMNSACTQQNCIPSSIVEESECDLLPSNYDERAMVGLDAMQRANSTLEDFCRSYLMFHGMDASSPQAIFKYLPVLSFTESYIYQLDTLNEKILDVPTNGILLEDLRSNS